MQVRNPQQVLSTRAMRVHRRVLAYLENPRAFTLWTWIKYYEKSKEEKHCTRTRKYMRRVLCMMIDAGRVQRVKSVRGGIAYRWRNDAR